MLDDEAKLSYKRRLVELRELVDDAREIGNAERAAELEDEIEALTRELRRAIGLGGHLEHSVDFSLTGLWRRKCLFGERCGLRLAVARRFEPFAVRCREFRLGGL